jgi:hypothetical protein
MLGLWEAPMSQIHHAVLEQSDPVAESTDKGLVSSDQRTGNQVDTTSRGTGNDFSARTAVAALVAMVILALPFGILLSSRAYLLTKLTGSQTWLVNNRSAVLAVDTFGLTIRSKNDSVATRELFEQAAVEHFARLHHTYSRWAERNHDLMGSLLLKLTVDETGAVVSVAPVASHVTNASFTKTVMADVRNWKFPQVGVEAAEITVPLLFVPKGMDPDTIVQWERKVRSAQEAKTSALGPRVADPAPISTVDESDRKPLPSVPHSDHANKIRLPKPKTEVEIAAAKTNRPLAIRENPRFSAKKVHDVDGDTRLSILENRGDWLKVKIADAGFIGFVRKEFVSAINERTVIVD